MSEFVRQQETILYPSVAVCVITVEDMENRFYGMEYYDPDLKRRHISSNLTTQFSVRENFILRVSVSNAEFKPPTFRYRAAFNPFRGEEGLYDWCMTFDPPVPMPAGYDKAVIHIN